MCWVLSYISTSRVVDRRKAELRTIKTKAECIPCWIKQCVTGEWVPSEKCCKEWWVKTDGSSVLDLHLPHCWPKSELVTCWDLRKPRPKNWKCHGRSLHQLRCGQKTATLHHRMSRLIALQRANHLGAIHHQLPSTTITYTNQLTTHQTHKHQPHQQLGRTVPVHSRLACCHGTENDHEHYDDEAHAWHSFVPLNSKWSKWWFLKQVWDTPKSSRLINHL